MYGLLDPIMIGAEVGIGIGSASSFLILGAPVGGEECSFINTYDTGCW